MFQLGETIKSRDLDVPKMNVQVDSRGMDRDREWDIEEDQDDWEQQRESWENNDNSNKPEEFNNNEQQYSIENDLRDNDIRPIMNHDFSYTYSPIVHGPKWFPTMVSNSFFSFKEIIIML